MLTAWVWLEFDSNLGKTVSVSCCSSIMAMGVMYLDSNTLIVTITMLNGQDKTCIPSQVNSKTGIVHKWCVDVTRNSQVTFGQNKYFATPIGNFPLQKAAAFFRSNMKIFSLLLLSSSSSKKKKKVDCFMSLTQTEKSEVIVYKEIRPHCCGGNGFCYLLFTYRVKRKYPNKSTYQSNWSIPTETQNPVATIGRFVYNDNDEIINVTLHKNWNS